MKKMLLEKVRLSQYFAFFLVFYIILVFVAPDRKFESGALTLFSVNSFLYGFYLAPILSAQKARIEELHKSVRAESNAIFGMVLGIKKLPAELRNQIQELFCDYLRLSIRQQKPGEGEIKYEALITYCVNYEGEYKTEIDKLLDKLIANQQNRTTFAMQMNSKVFSNEWMIILVLFSVTLSFVILMDAGTGLVYQILAALLCSGLSMLLLILLKMSTLTHKRAKLIWNPYKKLLQSHFYRLD